MLVAIEQTDILFNCVVAANFLNILLQAVFIALEKAINSESLSRG